jgi:putative alpha-1,2-mannosidase
MKVSSLWDYVGSSTNENPGKLPDCRMSLCKGYTQGGSNADVVLADAYLKNITNGVDWATGYEAVVSDAEGKAMQHIIP